jgi:queuine/archaeosine tRNA-ribosyltransferase
MAEQKIKVYGLVEDEDEYGEVFYQKLYDKEEQVTFFTVSNLNECPEDAIIGRDLFDAADYIKAVRRGIKLAKQGYTDVSFEVGDAE